MQTPSLITNKDFDSNFTIPDMPHDDSEKILKAGVKGARNGKIVKVDDYTFDYTVTDTAGNEVQNLAVKPVKEANEAGSNDGVEIGEGSKSGDSEGSSSGSKSGSSSGDDEEDAGAFLKPALLSLVIPALAMLL